MAPLIAGIVEGHDIRVDIEMLAGVPFPQSVPSCIDFDEDVGPHPLGGTPWHAPLHLCGQRLGDTLDGEIEGAAGRRAPGIVVVVGVAVFPHDVPVPIDFEQDAALESVPGRKALPGLVVELPQVEQVPVRQQIAVKPRRIRELPPMDFLPVEVEEIDSARAEDRRIEGVTWAGAGLIQGCQSCPRDAATGLWVNRRHAGLLTGCQCPTSVSPEVARYRRGTLAPR